VVSCLFAGKIGTLAVSTIKVGDTVGFGPQRGSCEHCEYCDSGNDNCCVDFEGLYDPKFGGYATSITVCNAI
jgi:D-arabinose 1-dehydrogenase-like Zn-dependent alcohol dehydrogenase